MHCEACETQKDAEHHIFQLDTCSIMVRKQTSIVKKIKKNKIKKRWVVEARSNESKNMVDLHNKTKIYASFLQLSLMLDCEIHKIF